jgi:heme exporter protein D
MSVSEFFDMGGYAFYVWSSYGLATVLLGWVFISPIFTKKSIIKGLRMKYRQQERQQQDSADS